MTWQEQERRRREVRDEARGLPREPASWLPRLALMLVTAVWLGTVAWLFVTLPERVPTHWSGGGVPDGWSSRPMALVMAVALPLVFAYPVTWLSRLVLVWPDGISAPHKEWWLATPRRLVRFERLMREDLMLMVALMVLVFVLGNVAIGYAAHQPLGQMPAWALPAVLGGFLAAMAVLMGRMLLGSRYRPRDDEPELAHDNGVT